ncbi:hypothetical protein Sjap_022749 [Stephania japonica]|uniref:Uncharacterized protein n=1 Tax=Stephania japonica TaxID=461633 RepID=A0AAP0ESJ1_9MAGN
MRGILVILPKIVDKHHRHSFSHNLIDREEDREEDWEEEEEKGGRERSRDRELMGSRRKGTIRVII